jgi:hypothetical protein
MRNANRVLIANPGGKGLTRKHQEMLKWILKKQNKPVWIRFF